MVWVEVAIWKFGVKITYFLLLYFVSSAITTTKILFKFKLSTKTCSLLHSFVVEQKLSPLFKRNISDLLGLVEEILQIVSHVSFCFLLLLMLSSCFYLGFSFKCQPLLFQNDLKAWSFCKFLCFFIVI